MKRILLIEDDGFKEEAVVGLLLGHIPFDEITCERSVQTAVVKLCEGPFDLIILDIALPSHDRTRGVGNPTSMPSGGIEVLLELNRLRRRDPILILTQYPEVEIWGELIKLPNVIARLNDEIEVNIVGLVYFDPTNPEWRERILTSIEGIK